MTSPNPHISCIMNGKFVHKDLCEIGAHVSVMTSKIYNKLFANMKIAPTSTKLIMGDGRTTKPLGVIKNLGVSIVGKIIPTGFFVLDACDDDHDDVIHGKPFIKLINAILDVGKGIITIEVDGNKHEFDFLPKFCSTSPLPLDNKEVESSCFVDSFRDPNELWRVILSKMSKIKI